MTLQTFLSTNQSNIRSGNRRTTRSIHGCAETTMRVGGRRAVSARSTARATRDAGGARRPRRSASLRNRSSTGP